MNPGLDPHVRNALDGDWNGLLQLAQSQCTKSFRGAPCVGMPPDTFFPHGDSPHDGTGTRCRLEVARVRQICRACPLRTRALCLVTALEQGDEYGIRGGVSAIDRQPLHRAWCQRVDEQRVKAALNGKPVALTATEKKRIIAAYIDDPALSLSRAARGLGLSRGAVAWAAHHERKRRARTTAASA
ncbi:WhiB family transcriptional regulator [Streptomyces sp. NPDC048172]|uniref:WhiB family transcriptional regulator n=1 Tax=Streptomyces sp. NPDC048172 TaxID=3365505 RepID=UPI00371F49E0